MSCLLSALVISFIFKNVQEIVLQVLAQMGVPVILLWKERSWHCSLGQECFGASPGCSLYLIMISVAGRCTSHAEKKGQKKELADRKILNKGSWSLCPLFSPTKADPMWDVWKWPSRGSCSYWLCVDLWELWFPGILVKLGQSGQSGSNSSNFMSTACTVPTPHERKGLLAGSDSVGHWHIGWKRDGSPEET